MPASASAGRTFDSRSDPVVERLEVQQPRRSLAVLAAGQSTLSASLVKRLVEERQKHPQNHELWAARVGDRDVAAAVLLPCPGRTALLFTWPLDGPVRSDHVRALAQAICSALDPKRVRMVQALLEPSQTAQPQGLVDAGFGRLAQLVYLQRRSYRKLTPLELEDGLRVQHYQPSTHKLFAEAILASYENTLDCPGLLGVRDIQDVIEGHKAAGTFVPELWLAVHCESEPAGVMLLNPLPDTQAAELVYLGISAPWRRRRLGKRLLEHALALAGAHGAQYLLLAVDDQNAPAMNLYRSLGFVPTARRVAFTRTIES